MVLKLKVSGSYLRSNESHDYELTVYMPECDNDHIQQSAMNRATPMALKKNHMEYDYLRSCYVDSIEAVELAKDTPKDEAEAIKEVESYKGKDIKELSYEEIQNAAIAYQLIGVPLYKQTDVRESRQRFYYEYCKEVLGENIEKDYDYANAKTVKLESDKKAAPKKQKTNTEILDGVEEESQKK